MNNLTVLMSSQLKKKILSLKFIVDQKEQELKKFLLFSDEEI